MLSVCPWFKSIRIWVLIHQKTLIRGLTQSPFDSPFHWPFVISYWDLSSHLTQSQSKTVRNFTYDLKRPLSSSKIAFNRPLPGRVAGTDMANPHSARPSLGRPLFQASSASHNGTLKRKRVGDHYTPLLTEQTKSAVAKRPRYHTSRTDAITKDLPEKSDGPEDFLFFVSHLIHQYEIGTDKLANRRMYTFLPPAPLHRGAISTRAMSGTILPITPPYIQLDIMVSCSLARRVRLYAKTPWTSRIANGISFTIQTTNWKRQWRSIS